MGCSVKKFLGLSLFIFCGITWAAPCPAGQSKDASVLVQIEQSWASALEKKDAATLGCLLAEEFQDVDPQGNISDRATTLAKAADHRPMHNELFELTPRVYGDFGYIRGLATATDAQGKITARVRFTDVYIYREGRWQAVAGQESMLPKP
jgi:predicted GNAT superfamily acetyltransferase